MTIIIKNLGGILLSLFLISCASFNHKMLKNYYPIEGYRTNLIETEGDTIPLVITLFKADTSSYYKWGLITVTNDNTHKLYKIYYRDGDGKYKGKELYEWDPEIDVATRITELRAGDFIFYKRIWEDLVK